MLERLACGSGSLRQGRPRSNGPVRRTSVLPPNRTGRPNHGIDASQAWWLGASPWPGWRWPTATRRRSTAACSRKPNDVHYELVVKPDSAELYVQDHGKPVPTAGMRGKLTVLAGGVKSDAELTPSGGNRLTAARVTIVPGAKVIAALTAADGKTTASLRYTIK